MKTKIILPLIAIIFLSSCADKFSLTKRKYTKGYYFASSKNNASSKNEHKNIASENLHAKNNTFKHENKTNVEVINPSISTISEFVKVNSSSTKTENSKPIVENITASSASKTNFTDSKAVKPLLEKRSYDLNQNIPASSDSNLILLIILCFLWWLNLIAVYIHDGKKITLNFWITLLLNFTFIGGVIFSLLVVLDIVDLK